MATYAYTCELFKILRTAVSYLLVCIAQILGISHSLRLIINYIWEYVLVFKPSLTFYESIFFVIFNDKYYFFQTVIHYYIVINWYLFNSISRVIQYIVLFFIFLENFRHFSILGTTHIFVYASPSCPSIYIL